MSDEELAGDGEQTPTEAFDEARNNDGVVDGDLPNDDSEGADDADQGPTAEDLNDPNSDYWQEQAKDQGWNDDPNFEPRSGKYRKTPREFVESGNLMSELHQIKQRQEKFDKATKAMHNTQLALQRSAHEGRISDLKEKRGEAIDESDREGADKIQVEIDKVRQDIYKMDDVPAATAQRGYEKPSESSEVKAYEAANPWVNDLHNPNGKNHQKAAYADQVFTQARNQGMSNAQALNAMHTLANQNFPAQSKPSRRDSGGGGEGGGRPRGGNRSKADVPYNQLTGQEQREIDTAVNNNMFSRAEAVTQINKYRNEG